MKLVCQIRSQDPGTAREAQRWFVAQYIAACNQCLSQASGTTGGQNSGNFFDDSVTDRIIEEWQPQFSFRQHVKSMLDARLQLTDSSQHPVALEIGLVDVAEAALWLNRARSLMHDRLRESQHRADMNTAIFVHSIEAILWRGDAPLTQDELAEAAEIDISNSSRTLLYRLRMTRKAFFDSIRDAISEFSENPELRRHDLVDQVRTGNLGSAIVATLLGNEEPVDDEVADDALRILEECLEPALAVDTIDDALGETRVTLVEKLKSRNELERNGALGLFVDQYFEGLRIYLRSVVGDSEQVDDKINEFIVPKQSRRGDSDEELSNLNRVAMGWDGQQPFRSYLKKSLSRVKPLRQNANGVPITPEIMDGIPADEETIDPGEIAEVVRWLIDARSLMYTKYRDDAELLCVFRCIYVDPLWGGKAKQKQLDIGKICCPGADVYERIRQMRQKFDKCLNEAISNYTIPGSQGQSSAGLQDRQARLELDELLSKPQFARAVVFALNANGNRDNLDETQLETLRNLSRDEAD